MSPTSIRYSSPEDRSVSMPFRYLERFRRRGNYGRKVLRLLGEQASWTSFLSHMWADKHLRAKRQCSSDYRLPLCSTTPHAPIADILFSSTHGQPACYTTLIFWKSRKPALAPTPYASPDPSAAPREDCRWDGAHLCRSRWSRREGLR